MRTLVCSLALSMAVMLLSQILAETGSAVQTQNTQHGECAECPPSSHSSVDDSNCIPCTSEMHAPAVGSPSSSHCNVGTDGASGTSNVTGDLSSRANNIQCTSCPATCGDSFVDLAAGDLNLNVGELGPVNIVCNPNSAILITSTTFSSNIAFCGSTYYQKPPVNGQVGELLQGTLCPAWAIDNNAASNYYGAWMAGSVTITIAGTCAGAPYTWTQKINAVGPTVTSTHNTESGSDMTYITNANPKYPDMGSWKYTTVPSTHFTVSINDMQGSGNNALGIIQLVKTATVSYTDARKRVWYSLNIPNNEPAITLDYLPILQSTPYVFGTATMPPSPAQQDFDDGPVSSLASCYWDGSTRTALTAFSYSAVLSTYSMLLPAQTSSQNRQYWVPIARQDWSVDITATPVNVGTPGTVWNINPFSIVEPRASNLAPAPAWTSLTQSHIRMGAIPDPQNAAQWCLCSMQTSASDIGGTAGCVQDPTLMTV